MKKTVVITGGSSGIGLAGAKYFIEKGWRVIELSRRGCDISEVKHISCDVADEASVEAAYKDALSYTESIDLLICNAGYGISGPVEATSIRDAKRQFDVNFFGAFSIAKTFIPALRKSKGRIIFISSAAAVFPIPFQSFYAASKAAVNSMACALRNELKPFGISVCALMPGDAKTGFTDARTPASDPEGIYGDKMIKSIAVMEKDERNGMSCEYVAGKIYKYAVKKHLKPTYTIGWKYKLFCLANKLLPFSLVNFIIYKMY